MSNRHQSKVDSQVGECKDRGIDASLEFREYPFDEAPWEILDAANTLADSGDLEAADAEYKRGLAAGKAWAEDSFTDALKDYGMFLSKIKRFDEAVEILEEVLKYEPDAAFYYSELMKVHIGAGHVEEMFKVADLYATRIPRELNQIPESIKWSALREAKEGNFKVAIDLLSSTEEWAHKHSLNPVRFEIWGERGHLIEKSIGIAAAEPVYRQAIEAGSTDRKTFTRLLMILEKTKRFDEAKELANLALDVQNVAAWEADIRKRLARIESRQNPGAHVQKEQIPAFSVRFGASNIELIEKKEYKSLPTVHTLTRDKKSALVTTVSKKESRITSLNLESGEEEWNRTLPEFHAPIHAIPNGQFLIAIEPARIGSGNTTLHWISDQGETTRAVVIPDKTTEIAVSDESIAIGCRDGCLYYFDLGGNLRWKHRVPSSDSSSAVPFHLSIAQNGKAVAYSFLTIVYFLDAAGNLLWIWDADENTAEVNRSVRPEEEAEGLAGYYRTLGVEFSDHEDDIYEAFSRLARESHPDFNPDDPSAQDKFSKVLRAFEAIFGDIEEEVEDYEEGEDWYYIGASTSGTIDDIVVSNDGGEVTVSARHDTITVIDDQSTVRSRLASLGRNGHIAVSNDFSTIVSTNVKGVSFYHREKGFFNVYDMGGGRYIPRLQVSPGGLYVAAWTGPVLQLFEMTGGKVAHLEFARRITSMLFRGDSEVIVSAGSLIRLRILEKS